MEFLNFFLILLIFFTSVTCGSVFEEEILISESPPRLLIGAGKAITRNTRRITDIRTDSTVNTINVYWNMTPTSVQGFPCCPFTLIEVYPLNSMGRKIPGESVVLLKPNVTEYRVNVSQIATEEMGISDYLICIRLWHRFGGKERKLDESCIKAKTMAADEETNLIAIVFGVAVGVNISLVAGLVVVKLVRRRKSPTGFAVRKWWKDGTDVRQQQPSLSPVSLESRLTNDRRPSGISGGSLNNALSISMPNSPIIQDQRRVGGNGQIPTVSAAVANEYSCLNNQVYDLFLAHPQYQMRRSSNQIYIVRNGLFSDPSTRIAIV